MVVLLLLCGFNMIIRLEQIPLSFKLGVIVPVYKGKGCDPHICNNYQGITLTSVLSKCLKLLFFGDWNPCLLSGVFPKQHTKKVYPV